MNIRQMKKAALRALNAEPQAALAEPVTDGSCLACFFSRPGVEGERLCRRYPEITRKKNGDWCGEFKPVDGA